MGSEDFTEYYVTFYWTWRIIGENTDSLDGEVGLVWSKDIYVVVDMRQRTEYI